MARRLHPAKLLTLFLPTAILSLGACSNPGPQGSLPAAEDWVTLPADFEGDYFFLPMRLDGREDRTLWFLYDTGASYTVVDPESLERVAEWDSSQGSRVRFGELHCGDVVLSKVSSRVKDLDHLRNAVGRDFDGILGYREFQDVLLNLDYPNARIRIAEGILPRSDGRTVVRILGKGRPYVDSEIGGREVRLLIDSGSGSGFKVRDRRYLNWLFEPTPVGSSMGIDGLNLQRAGRIDGSAWMFGVEYLDPVLRIVEETELVGTEILGDFSLIFDQRHRRLHIAPTVGAQVEPEALRGTGAIFSPTEEGMEVLQVLSGSAAERAGLQVGDHVLEVSFMHRSDDPESPRDFHVRRGGQHMQMRVEMSDLVPVR
ncbi:MAG: hypothetical protein ACYTEP_00345 [Planctomycetota bacterium]